MDLSRADPGYGLRVERSREVRLAEGDAGDPRGVAVASVEVEVSWVAEGRGVREVVDLFRFKELFREAARRGLPVALSPGYVHQREGADSAPGSEGEPPGPPAEEAGEPFDLLARVRELLRREADSVGPAYG